MTTAIRTVTGQLVRFAVLWVVDAFAIAVTAALVPNMWIEAVDGTPRWAVAVAAAFVLALVNLLVRPIVLLLARPFGFFVTFGVGFLVNALALLVTARLLPGFHLEGLLWAIVAGIVSAAVNVFVTGILDVGEEGSVYQNLIERLAARDRPPADELPARGLVMLEIDGLSFHQLKRALAEKRLPTLQRMIDEEGYVLTRYDCGLPSQTSACQAGIMFGDNSDIPAFRWFDKRENRLYESGKHAKAINDRYAKGSGLLRGGSSIVNMMGGDAAKSLLTAASIRSASEAEEQRRTQDIYLLMLNPYFLMRSIALFLAESVREVWQGWQQKRHDVQPRMDRLQHFYPLVRGATVVFVRDLLEHLVVLDIIRGAPAIYATWPGYDEVAHHSGPFTSDAMGALASYDRVVRRIREAIREKAPIPYDLVILSDHGQSFGATFKQRYGLSLKELIEQQLPGGTSVAQAVGGDTGVTALVGVNNELGNIQEQGLAGVPGRAVIRQGQKALAKGIEASEADLDSRPAQVMAYGSGNLAQVYLDLYPRKTKLSELRSAYPALVDALVQHEGIGFVVGYEDDETAVVLGKRGSRNLHTGEVNGEDPLLPYANPDPDGVGHATPQVRAEQLRYVMDFPSAGDLLVNSAVYPDGTVAALEELIGNHGGVGGEQTDAFLFHPSDLTVPTITNSKDVFPILNERRGLPPPPPPSVELEPHVAASAWAPANLFGGLRDLRWVGLAARALVLDRTAYRRIARDERLTGPATLLVLLGALVSSVAVQQGFDTVAFLLRLVAWLLAAFAVYGAGRLLTGRGEFTSTFRALGFAQTAALVKLLALAPVLAPVALISASLLGFLAAWTGAAEAHRTRGWRTVVLPVAAIGLAVVAFAVLNALLRGGGFAIASLLADLGLE